MNYGVILFWLSLNTFLPFVEIGLSTTVFRITATQTKDADSVIKLQNEVGACLKYIKYASIASAIVLVVSSNYIAFNYLYISSDELKNSVAWGTALWGAVIACRFPMALLQSGLNGFNHQSLVNKIIIKHYILRTILLLAFGMIGGGVLVYAMTYTICSLIEYFENKIALDRVLKSYDININASSIKSLSALLPFSIGIAITSISAFFLKFFDKLILPAFVDMGIYANYMSVYTLMFSLTLISSAIVKAMFPAMVKNSSKNGAYLNKDFKKISFSSTIGTGIGFMLIVSNCDFVLNLYIPEVENYELARISMILLGISFYVNSIMQAPQYVAWANANSKHTAINNFVSAILFLPIMFLLIVEYGVIGAALCWLIYNTLYFIVFPCFLFRKSPSREVVNWYASTLLPVIFIVFISLTLSKVDISEWARLYASILIASILSGVAFIKMYKTTI